MRYRAVNFNGLTSLILRLILYEKWEENLLDLMIFKLLKRMDNLSELRK